MLLIIFYNLLCQINLIFLLKTFLKALYDIKLIYKNKKIFNPKKVKKFIKFIFKPIAILFTKLFFDIDTIKPHIKKVYWEESNAFKWASSYVIKNQIKGDYVEFGVWKGNSFIEMYRQIKINSEIFYINNKKKKFKI